MFRLILTLACLLSTFLMTIAASAKDPCPVGESSASDGSICADVVTGENNCAAYCVQTYSKELNKSACSNARPDTNQRECICHLNGVNGLIWGTGFTHQFDGKFFGYQGLKKFYVFKPCKPFTTIPNFEIHQATRIWAMIGGWLMAMDSVEVIVPEFDQRINVAAPKLATERFVVTINNKIVAVPYKFSRFNKHREEFINVVFTDANKLYLVITTSFGLRITLISNIRGMAFPNAMYSDISVDIPRHPELKGNTCGTLGRWNDDPNDDSIDANGKNQTLHSTFSSAYGDSWIVPADN